MLEGQTCSLRRAFTSSLSENLLWQHIANAENVGWITGKQCDCHVSDSPAAGQARAGQANANNPGAARDHDARGDSHRYDCPRHNTDAKANCNIYAHAHALTGKSRGLFHEL